MGKDDKIVPIIGFILAFVVFAVIIYFVYMAINTKGPALEEMKTDQSCITFDVLEDGTIDCDTPAERRALGLE